MPIVATNGCFDVLHAGHLSLLKFCYDLSDDCVVEVYLDSDEKVRKDKGENRPYFSYQERASMLYQTKYVSWVFKFDTNEQLDKLFFTEPPDILVKGSDWKGKEVIGSKYVKEVVFFDKDIDISTTKIEEKIKNKCSCHKDIIKHKGFKFTEFGIICMNCGKINER